MRHLKLAFYIIFSAGIGRKYIVNEAGNFSFQKQSDGISIYICICIYDVTTSEQEVMSMRGLNENVLSLFRFLQIIIKSGYLST